jgi:hypothetical protein
MIADLAASSLSHGTTGPLVVFRGISKAVLTAPASCLRKEEVSLIGSSVNLTAPITVSAEHQSSTPHITTNRTNDPFTGSQRTLPISMLLLEHYYVAQLL